MDVISRSYSTLLPKFFEILTSISIKPSTPFFFLSSSSLDSSSEDSLVDSALAPAPPAVFFFVVTYEYKTYFK